MEASRRLTMADAATIPCGERRVPLADLVDSWSGHVLRLYEERDQRWDDRTRDLWGLDDLAAAYLIRDRIDRAMESIERRPPHSVGLADAMLRSFTEESDGSWAKLAGEPPGARWWWRRVPTSGPIVEQLRGLGLDPRE
jgi:hypothetical protein